MNSHHSTFYLTSGMTGNEVKTSSAPHGLPSRTLTSDVIFEGEREIGIEHHGALYRLKVTRQGKLILNK